MDGKLYLAKWAPKVEPQKVGLRVLSYYIGVDESGKEEKDDRLSIVVEAGDYWPVILKFSDEEALKLIGQLAVMLRDRDLHKPQQTSAHWE